MNNNIIQRLEGARSGCPERAVTAPVERADHFNARYSPPAVFPSLAVAFQAGRRTDADSRL
jgi:hypothetical protein